MLYKEKRDLRITELKEGDFSGILERYYMLNNLMDIAIVSYLRPKLDLHISPVGIPARKRKFRTRGG